MKEKKYCRVGSDGSMITVEREDIFDHVETVAQEAKALAAVLANQDPAGIQQVQEALSLNREYMDRVCHLLEFMTTEVRARPLPPTSAMHQPSSDAAPRTLHTP